MQLSKLITIVVVAAAALLWLPQAAAQQPAGVASVTHLSGTLTVRRADGSQRFLSVKSAVAEGDTLQTVQGTYARVRFNDGAEVVLRPESQMKVEAFKFEQASPASDNMLLRLVKGGMRSVTGILGRRSRDKVQFAAPTATVGIRGTHFGMLLCQNDCAGMAAGGGRVPPNGLHVDVVDGQVSVSNAAGQQLLNAGQFGYVRDAGSPPAVVPPSQGVQVTMPLTISRNAGSGATLGKERQDNECVVP